MRNQYYNINMKNNFGFTLAEVLITIGIVGIVAALTIPMMIANYQKKIVATKVKSVYSTFSQAIARAKAEYGDMNSWDQNLPDNEFVKKYLLPYLSNVEVCESNSAKKHCKRYNLHTLANDSSNYYLHWSNSSITTPHYFLKNGTRFFVRKYNANDNYYILTVDINNSKGPNLMGRDGFVFLIHLNRNNVVPSGFGLSKEVLITNRECGCSKTNKWTNVHYAGQYCAALMMLEGWEISDNYPW